MEASSRLSYTTQRPPPILCALAALVVTATLSTLLHVYLPMTHGHFCSRTNQSLILTYLLFTCGLECRLSYCSTLDLVPSVEQRLAVILQQNRVVYFRDCQ